MTDSPHPASRPVLQRAALAALSSLVLILSGTGVAQEAHDAQEETPWKAGAAKVEITPEELMWMAGYGSRKAPAEGKLTPLWAKALALEDAEGNRGVIVTLDLVGIGRELSRKVCQTLESEYGLARHQVALCVSHTHSGPVVGKNLGPLHYWVVDDTQKHLIEAYAESLHGKIVQVAGEALAHLQPARVQWGSGKCTFAVNRRENKPYTSVPEWREKGTLKGPVDHDVPVLTLRDEAGAVQAVLFGYACHATVLNGNQWCADYPGYAQTALEEAYPGAVALFWAGCGGDQNPLPRQEIPLAMAYGEELAAAVEDVINAPMAVLPPILTGDYEEIALPLAQLPTGEELRKTILSENRFEAARAKLLIGELEETGGLEAEYPYPVQRWRLGGEIDFVFLGGEVVVDYALRLKKERHGLRTWVAGYSNDVMAYIPSLRVLKEGGYEGGDSNTYYGLPGLWAPEVEETIVKTVNR